MSLLLAMAAFLVIDDPITDWETISPADGGFTIRLPANSVTTSRRVNSDDRPSEVVIIQSTVRTMAYMVTYVDVSPTTARMPKSLLDGTRDVVVLSSKGKLLSEKKIVLGKNAGREIRAEVALGQDRKGGILRCRIYLVGTRVFQVMAIGPKDEVGSKEVDAFFGSFKLTPAR